MLVGCETLSQSRPHCLQASHPRRVPEGLCSGTQRRGGHLTATIRRPIRDPSLEQIESEIRRVSSAASRVKWQGCVQTLDSRSNPKWQLLRNLSGAKSSVPPYQFINFGNKLCSKPAAIAKKINHQYTYIRKHSSSKVSHLINRNLSITASVLSLSRILSMQLSVPRTCQLLAPMALRSFTSNIWAPWLSDT